MATESIASRLRIVLFVAVLAGAGAYLLALSGCTRRQEAAPNVPPPTGQAAAQPAQNPTTPPTAKAEQNPPAQPVAEAAKYVCPMHPEVVSDKPGKCPKCGMNLVLEQKPPAAQ